jgi:hypothetical protein
MKNPKILQFGDWFKVYEKAGSNFNKTQRLLESEMLLEKDAVLYGDLGISKPGAGADLDYNDLPNLTSMKTAVEEAIIKDQYYTAAVDKIKNFGSTVERHIMRGGDLQGKDLNRDTGAEAFLANLIAARAIRLGKKNKKRQEREAFKSFVARCIKNFDIQRSDANDLKLTPEGVGEDGKVKTVSMVGTVDSAKSIIKYESQSKWSYMSRLAAYINTWNFLQWASNGNDNAAYDQQSIKDGYFDLQVAAGKAGVPANPAVLFYADQFYERATAERGEETRFEDVGGVDGAKGQADIQFAVGKSTIEDSETPKIKALAEVVKAKFGKDQTVDSFELISSASPEYGAIKNEQGWESKYPNGTTAMGDPGVGTDDASKNAKLAWDRGVSFMEALNTELAKLGHPGFNNYVIKWQIAAEGGPSGNGRFVDLQIERNYQKPKVKATTTVTGRETSAGGSQRQKATLYAYKFVVGKGAGL